MKSMHEGLIIFSKREQGVSTDLESLLFSNTAASKLLDTFLAPKGSTLACHDVLTQHSFHRVTFQQKESERQSLSSDQIMQVENETPLTLKQIIKV